jgi:hypothetical protein
MALAGQMRRRRVATDTHGYQPIWVGLVAASLADLPDDATAVDSLAAMSSYFPRINGWG